MKFVKQGDLVIDKVGAKAEEDDYLVLIPQNNSVVVINSTAKAIIDALSEPKSKDQLIDVLSQIYDIGDFDIEPDVLEILDRLKGVLIINEID